MINSLCLIACFLHISFLGHWSVLVLCELLILQGVF